MLRQGDDLVAGILDGTCLVPGHMTGGSSHYALPPLQHGRDDDGVALGAAGDELHIGLRAGAGGADLLAGAGAVGVGAVAGDLFKVGLGQLLQNGGVCTLAVVVFKIQHGKTLLYIIVRKQYLYSTSPCKPCQTQNGAGTRKAPQKRLQDTRCDTMLTGTTAYDSLFYESMIIFKKMKSFSKKCLTILLHLV